MKKILVLIAIVFAAMQLTAANVDLVSAQQSAQRFLMSQTAKGRFMTSAPTVKWTHEVKTSSNATLAAYYFVNIDCGYVIVSGDDRAKTVLAYGDGSLSSLNDLPEAVQYFLDIYQKQMEYLQAHPGLVVKKIANTRGVSVEPMLQTAWAQDKPYNKQCPKVGNNNYCKVGCTAVALAQVMRFWEYPTTSPALPAYKCEDSGINVSALPEYTFDWDNMYDTYYGVDLDRLPQVNEDAIAYLMRYVGQAEHVDYNTDKTGTRNPEILTAINTFGFDEGANIVKKCDSPDTQEELSQGAYTEEEYYNDEEWAEAIQAELRAGRPLIYCAYDMSSDSTGLGGHAFNVDGYNAETDMYHVNFGMNPSLNTYYALNAFSTDGWMIVYDFWPIFFGGVQPPGLSTDPRILVSTQDVAMECYAGETATDTITVNGQYLTEGISVALNDENDVFSINVTSIALEDAGNASIVVTYAPQAVGTHTATITLSSEGAAEKVVHLVGTATSAPLVVYDPVMLPADESKITATSFRADWTDQTVPENVASYTLEVKEKPGAGGVLVDVDWSTASGNAEDYLPEGWTVGDYSIFFDEGGIAITSDSYIKTDVLDLAGCDKVTIVMRAKNYSPWFNSTITVKTSIDQKYLELTSDYTDYTIVLNCAENDQVEFFANAYYPTIQAIKIYAGEVTAPQMRATEEGDASSRIITGITDKFYTVNGLTANGTFRYKVKAVYNDGTESAWSNVEEVTLVGPAYSIGDVNHDGHVNITDVTSLIDYLLGDITAAPAEADVNGEGGVTITDMTALIDLLLGSN